LSPKARRICESPSKPLYVSSISLWELITKCEAGSLEIPSVGSTLQSGLDRLNARALPLEAAHAFALYGLPLLHHDPFDRALIAQAHVEELTLVTCDEANQRYPSVKWVW